MTSSDSLQRAVEQASQVILGKQGEIRLAITCLLARGHLLIEDLPGVGKTTLAHVLAQVFGLDFQRVQFTSDLLPGDILGASVFNRETASFEFHPGPIFAQLILADEVNRATPKTQSALLEAMEEFQVTVEGTTHPLPKPFFVIATQNPFHQVGTFPLPESQLDRFLIRVRLGYPNRDAERELLQGTDRRKILKELPPCLSPEDLTRMQSEVDQVHVSEPILDYVQGLIRHTRESADYAIGLSPRAGIALIQAARAWAYLHGRAMLLPEDIQAVLPGVVTHRLRGAVVASDTEDDDICRNLILAVPAIA